MESLSCVGTRTGQEETEGVGRWDTKDGSPQSLDAVRIEQKAAIGSNKSNDYSFRKPAFNSDKLTFDERSRDSNERKPASPISGLDDKMKTIEEKIKKYKQENEHFEKGSQNHSATIYQSQKAPSDKPVIKSNQDKGR
jgi:hypothetical protein